jgi:hypothetical protein
MFNIFFSENLIICEIMRENVVELDRLHITM